MRNKKGSGSVALIVLMIIIMVLLGLLIYTNIKNQLVKEEFKDFTTFQVEFSKFVVEECNMEYEVQLNHFLKYKVNEILNETNLTNLN